MTDDLFDSLFNRKDFKQNLEKECIVKQLPFVLIATQTELFNQLCELLIKKGVVADEEIQSLKQDTAKKVAETFYQQLDENFEKAFAEILEELNDDKS